MRTFLSVCLFTLLAAMAFAANGPPDILVMGVGGKAPSGGFSPNSLALIFWFDPSDSTSVFTDAGCTTPAVNGNTVNCIRDKTTNNCDATSTAGPVLTVGPPAFLTFNGTTQFFGVACLLSYFTSVGYGSMHASIAATSVTGNPVILGVSTSGPGTARFFCGYDPGVLGGANGWGLRGRRLDTDAGQNVESTNQSTSALALRCAIQWQLATAQVFINNSSAASSGAFQTTGVTDSAAVGALTGVGVSNATTPAGFFNGKLYQIQAYSSATTDLTSTNKANLDTWNCTKAGISC